MPSIAFQDMPASGRLWIFAAGRDLDATEERHLLGAVDRFLDGWKAHGQPLTSAREWRAPRFLFVAVDPASEPPSGCSIDAMVRLLRELESDLGVALTDHAPVHYREGREVRSVSRAEFRRLADGGDVGPGTHVYDATITTLADLREGKWERPARETWHARAFFRQAAAG